jgi:N-hydroxyarylamine O-acetyltransferase
MRFAIDLDAYCRRIGHTDALHADLTTLRALVRAHVATIAYENIDPLLAVPVDLDLAAIEDKLVHGRRGGYCFEHNLLFRDVLRNVGFEVAGMLARVLWNRPADAMTAQTHMLLRVELDGQRYLVDVGFGALTPTGVLAMQADIEQATPHEPFRLLTGHGDWQLQVRLNGQWRALYRFDLHTCEDIDYAVASYYASTHPDSPFTGKLVVARAAGDHRLVLNNREFVIHARDGGTQRCSLPNAAQIRRVLETEFGIRLPGRPEIDRRLNLLR